MSESRFLWYGQSIDDKSREELIDIIKEMSRINEATASRGVEDIRLSELFRPAPITRQASAEPILQPRPSRPAETEKIYRGAFPFDFCVIGFFAVLLAVLAIMKLGAN